jgi:ATP-dependent exoDNAse (exonuclease V) beta subunit
VEFAGDTGYSVLDFVHYLSKVDPTLGLPPEKVITMTTVHRTKGLEYDYVFIPACTEGNMPVHMAQTVEVYDKSGQVPDHPPSPALESERRLFYVAATRVVKHLYIGTIQPPQRGQQSQSGTALPSRFLEEIQLEPTRELIGSLQKFTADPSAPLSARSDSILATVRRLADLHSLINSFTQSYLASSEESTLAQAIAQRIQQTPETAFGYRFDYPDIERGQTKKNRQEPNRRPGATRGRRLGLQFNDGSPASSCSGNM